MDSNAAEAPAENTRRLSDVTPWQLVLMGRVEARSATTSITRWPSRAVAALLARLALLPNRVHGREELIELLWPGVSLDAGRGRLRQALSSLRSLLRPADATAPAVLLTDRQTVRMNAQALDCDVLQFERHLAAGRHAAARACYVGELMPGFFDDWIVAERHRLEALFGRLPPPSALAPCAATPVDAVESHGRTTPRSALPSYWSRAFGQEAIVDRLVDIVQARRLVTVLGPGGNGKTRLAVAAARTLADAAAPAFDQVVFVPLVDDRSAQEVWDALARAFRAEGTGRPAHRVLARIGQQTSLLVLDNVEQVNAELGDVLTELLQACPALHLLLTSRRRVGMQGEQVFEMPGLPVPEPSADGAYRPDAVVDNPSVALFVDRARESRPEFHLTPHNVTAVVGLVRLLGGMPLAIELAASRVRAMQPRELLERLRHDAGSPLLDLLARPSATATARSRHASMRHVVAWSWSQLRPEVTDLLRAMSVFSAPATVEAITQALTGLRGAAPESPGSRQAESESESLVPGTAAVQALLGDALEASLVQAVPPPTAGPPPDTAQPDASIVRTAYALLPPVREYAAEQCTASEPRRVRSWLRRWLAAQALQGMPRQRTALEADLVHVWSLMLRAADDADPQAALALGVYLKGEWNRAPSMPELLGVLEGALAQQPAGTQDAVVSQAHYMLAVQYQLRALNDRAVHHAHHAVASAPDDLSRALALSIRSWIGVQQGADALHVQPDLVESEELASRCGDARAQALIAGLRASVAVKYFEDYAAAEILLNECVRMFDGQGDVGQACFRRIELALCWAWTGREAQALAALEAAVHTCRTAGLSLILVYALTSLGRVRMRVHDGEAARHCLEEAARNALECDWPALLPPVLLHLSGAWALSDRANPAALLFGHAMCRWAHDLGSINRPEARELKRNRRLLRLALGPAVAQELITAGGRMSAEDLVALLRDGATAADPTRH